MDYTEARAAFFQPRNDDAAPAGTSAWQSPVSAEVGPGIRQTAHVGRAVDQILVKCWKHS